MRVAKDSIRIMLEQKLLNDPNHEVGLILFGSSETNNDSGLDNINVLREIQKVDLDFFRSV